MNNKDNINHEKLEIYMDEYRIISAQISKRVDYQQKLINYQLIAAGIIVPIALGFLGMETNAKVNSIYFRYFLLLSPIIFLTFCWSFYNHDIHIVSLARYINKELRLKIKTLLNGEDILSYEEFLSKERILTKKRFGMLPSLGKGYLIPLILPAIFLIMYLTIFFFKDLFKFFESRNQIFIYLFQFILFIIDIIFFILTISFKIKAGKNYQRILN